MPDREYPRKLSIISPENIVKNEFYSFTINPSDDYQYWNTSSWEERIKSLSAYMTHYMLKKINARVVLHMEFSRTGRLHFHGTICFIHTRQIQEFYLMTIHWLLDRAQIEMDTLKDQQVWNTYCRKSNHLISEVFETNNIQLKRCNGYASVVAQKDIVEMFSGDGGSPEGSPPSERPINKKI